ncbi:hypothetical protein RBB82_00535 [Tunturiibacter lichenicola]
MQGGSGVVVCGGGEGKVAGGLGEIVFVWKGFRPGNGALEEGLGGGEVFEVNLDVGGIVEEGGVLRRLGDEGGVEGGSLIVLLVVAVEPGKQAGEGGVVGMGGVELDRNGDSLGSFALLLVEAG